MTTKQMESVELVVKAIAELRRVAEDAGIEFEIGRTHVDSENEPFVIYLQCEQGSDEEGYLDQCISDAIERDWEDE